MQSVSAKVLGKPGASLDSEGNLKVDFGSMVISKKFLEDSAKIQPKLGVMPKHGYTSIVYPEGTTWHLSCQTLNTSQTPNSLGLNSKLNFTSSSPLSRKHVQCEIESNYSTGEKPKHTIYLDNHYDKRDWTVELVTKSVAEQMIPYLDQSAKEVSANISNFSEGSDVQTIQWPRVEAKAPGTL